MLEHVLYKPYNTKYYPHLIVQVIQNVSNTHKVWLSIIIIKNKDFNFSEHICYLYYYHLPLYCFLLLINTYLLPSIAFLYY